MQKASAVDGVTAVQDPLLQGVAARAAAVAAADAVAAAEVGEDGLLCGELVQLAISASSSAISRRENQTGSETEPQSVRHLPALKFSKPQQLSNDSPLATFLAEQSTYTASHVLEA